MPDEFWWMQAPSSVPWPEKVCSPTLHTAMERYVSSHNRIVPNTTAFALALNKMTMTTLRRVTTRWNTPEGNHRTTSAIVNLPSLTECRGAFEAYKGRPFVWPDGERTSFGHSDPSYMVVPEKYLK